MTAKTMNVDRATVCRDWVDEILLGGQDSDVCLRLDEPVTRGQLRQAVHDRQNGLYAKGLRGGGTVALWLPPSLEFVVNLLAVWRSGGQAMLFDYRLTQHEVHAACQRLLPQLVLRVRDVRSGAMRGYVDVVSTTIETWPGRPATTDHVLIQLSSGSTGPSKVIGRTMASLTEELDRYSRMDGVPRAGERIVLLASMVHVLGLVGGVMFGLHTGAEVVLPRRLTGEGIVHTIAAGSAPTTVIGVPFHIELLGAVSDPPALPHLVRMTTGGELVRPQVAEPYLERYAGQLGTMYGMTETGVIAEDLYGRYRPALAPAPGMALRVENGELLVRTERTPYVGTVDPGRWVDGWLHTKDAGTIDEATGLVTVHGRLDAQVSIGGLKVDLMEVEQVVAGIPGVVEAVLVYDGGIEAYVVLDGSSTVAEFRQFCSARLAPYKRPLRVHVLEKLPRTVTGKLVRELSTLRTVERMGGQAA